ncbi:hypothetical protein J7K50_00225, partial [bacterium]|nr:hypothetical protein [bacterium]
GNTSHRNDAQSLVRPSRRLFMTTVTLENAVAAQFAHVIPITDSSTLVPSMSIEYYRTRMRYHVNAPTPQFVIRGIIAKCR